MTADWGMKTARSGFHFCPRKGCAQEVPNRLFSCRGDWFQLSKPVRDAIYATAGRSTRERFDAIAAAREEWARLDAEVSK